MSKRIQYRVLPQCSDVMELAHFLSSQAWEFGRGKENAVVNNEGPYGYGLEFMYRGDRFQLSIAQMVESEDEQTGYGEGGYGEEPFPGDEIDTPKKPETKPNPRERTRNESQGTA